MIWDVVRPRGRSAIRLSVRDGLHLGAVLGYLVGVVLLGMTGEWLPGVALVPASAVLTAVTVRLLARPARPGAVGWLVALPQPRPSPAADGGGSLAFGVDRAAGGVAGYDRCGWTTSS